MIRSVCWELSMLPFLQPTEFFVLRSQIVLDCLIICSVFWASWVKWEVKYGWLMVSKLEGWQQQRYVPYWPKRSANVPENVSEFHDLYFNTKQGWCWRTFHGFSINSASGHSFHKGQRTKQQQKGMHNHLLYLQSWRIKSNYDKTLSNTEWSIKHWSRNQPPLSGAVASLQTPASRQPPAVCL